MFLFKRKEEATTTPINSKEYSELLQKFETLRISVEALKLDLDLYKKKLRLSKGIKREEDEDNEDYKNSVILPER